MVLQVRHQHLRRRLALLATAKRMHVDGELLDRFRVKAPTPGRHHAAASAPDRVGDGRLVASIKPKLIGQIGRADRLIALAFRTMAWRASGGEDLAPALSGLLVVSTARQG